MQQTQNDNKNWKKKMIKGDNKQKILVCVLLAHFAFC